MMSDLMIITVTLTTKTQHQLFFDNSGKAREAYITLAGQLTHLNGPTGVEVTDEYGCRMSVRLMDVVSVEERVFNRQRDAMVEAELIGARANARGQQRAASDPTLKLLAQAQGPGMLRA
jgi:hypothetical protein